MQDLKKIIEEQLEFFETEGQRQAFLSFQVPVSEVVQTWGYGDESHTCFILAKNDAEQIVYCNTGFGPAFPWSVQRLGDTDLGTDAQWHAYLYEAFITSTIRQGSKPINFILMGPGERRKHNV
jgi:hypothetical protein